MNIVDLRGGEGVSERSCGILMEAGRDSLSKILLTSVSLGDADRFELGSVSGLSCVRQEPIRQDPF